MTSLRYPAAYVDFRCPEPLMTLAQKLSDQLFGGIEFVGENTGIWDEVPAVRLAKRFLGLNVELGGADGSFTLQIEPANFPWDQVPAEETVSVSVDLSGLVGHLLTQIPGVVLVSPGRSE